MKISSKQLGEAALLAYEEKRLAFQHAAPCHYLHDRLEDGRPIGCAIGVGLPDEILDALPANGRCNLSVMDEAITSHIDFENIGAAALLQESHDLLSIGNCIDTSNEIRESRLLRFINQARLMAGKRRLKALE